MSEQEPDNEQAIREAAYFIWEREGRPEGRAEDHWIQAIAEIAHQEQRGHALIDEEKLLDGHPDADMPALLTKDVPGG